MHRDVREATRRDRESSTRVQPRETLGPYFDLVRIRMSRCPRLGTRLHVTSVKSELIETEPGIAWTPEDFGAAP